MNFLSWLFGRKLKGVDQSATDLGNMLIRMGLVTPHDLARAVTAQLDELAPVPAHSRFKWVASAWRRLVLWLMPHKVARKRLGEIMVDMGYITPNQLRNALHAQLLMRKGKQGDAMLVVVDARADHLGKMLNLPLK